MEKGNKPQEVLKGWLPTGSNITETHHRTQDTMHTTGHTAHHRTHCTLQDTPQDTYLHTTGHTVHYRTHCTPQDTPQDTPQNTLQDTYLPRLQRGRASSLIDLEEERFTVNLKQGILHYIQSYTSKQTQEYKYIKQSTCTNYNEAKNRKYVYSYQ